MTGERLLLIQFVLEILLIGAVFLALPRFTRRGLLFGVYVGEDRSGTPEARRVVGIWYAWMAPTVLGSLAACLWLGRVLGDTAAYSLASLLLLTGAVGGYLRAHFAARALVADRPVPVEDPPEAEPPSTSLLPLLTIGLVVVLAGSMAAFALTHYAGLPERIPTHFNAAGEPDGWSRKSAVQVLLLPSMALVIGVFLGILAHLTLHSNRGLRRPVSGRSIEAQRRFRIAISRLCCLLALMTTGLLAVVSYTQIQTARGLATAAAPAIIFAGMGVWVVVMGAVIYIVLRYGQGGARLEPDAAGRVGALTDGLADDRHWKLGLIYVNREDPSILIEKRFGIGYTINFGNPKAIALLAGFFVSLLGLVAVAALTG